MFIDATFIAATLAQDISYSGAKIVAHDHPTMKKVNSLQTKLAISHITGQPVIEIDEEDLVELVTFTNKCMKIHRPNPTPRTLRECYEMLVEGALSSRNWQELKTFNDPAKLRDEMRDIENRLLDSHFIKQMSSPNEEHVMLYPDVLAWDYDHVVLEVEENSFRYLHWKEATDLVRQMTVQYAYA
ncbi:MAG: hypothetical protein OXC95_13795 [Dehalococcoidia bacterium]|nr:hypothetical protein [Dehalococcoidia bacterium]